jgi:hypothetical protein
MRLRWLNYQSGSHGDGGNTDLYITDVSIRPSNSSIIDGSSITTGSITADQISAEIADFGEITADDISTTGTLHSADGLTFFDLDTGVIIIKDNQETPVVRVKLGDLSASDDFE